MKGWNNLHSVRWDANGNGFFVVLVSGRPIFLCGSRGKRESIVGTCVTSSVRGIARRPLLGSSRSHDGSELMDDREFLNEHVIFWERVLEPTISTYDSLVSHDFSST